ncbi:heavy-metal-associated domain-containing protein [Clostridium drakei]|uniref:Heavy metal transport/detoxification protein n=1 Tax=Clostridium drakei TaxID=332101 RepID=A0A2U8DMI3_9CLOT|nr:heavy-metal-associated domain-containing protein [Clostridium drakei]AWI03645.1 heavy metal transport/detoxification protein [Clostridium drakei]
MKKKLTIDGMSCMHCVNHVYQALMNISEVTSVNIDLKTQIAFLESNKSIDNDVIKSAISNVGYKVIEIEKIYV